MQDGLDEDNKALATYLRAKICQEMMQWVMENPPPDMREAQVRFQCKLAAVHGSH